MFNFYLINLNIKAFEKITSCSERGFIIVGENNRRRWGEEGDGGEGELVDGMRKEVGRVGSEEEEEEEAVWSGASGGAWSGVQSVVRVQWREWRQSDWQRVTVTSPLPTHSCLSSHDKKQTLNKSPFQSILLTVVTPHDPYQSVCPDDNNWVRGIVFLCCYIW